MNMMQLLEPFLTPIEYTPKIVREKEKPRQLKYLVRTGMENRHSKRRAEKLALQALPSGKPTSKIVQAAREGRIGLNQPLGLAMGYFMEKKKKI